MTAQRLLDSDLSQDLNFLLARTRTISIASANRALRELGLNVRSYSTLALACGGLMPSQRELADMLMLDPSQVVGIVDDLEARGLVHRHPSPRDRRANVVSPTEDGQELFASAQPVTHRIEEELVEGLAPEEQSMLRTLLRRLAFRTDSPES